MPDLASEASPAARPNEVIAGRYEIVRVVGRGGMGTVYEAIHTWTGRRVALKTLLPHLAEDPEFVQMFLNEAKIASRFNHPNIAQIYDLGETGGQYFIAMEFIHGEDLGRVMRRAWSTGQWIARHISLRMMADCCQGLHYAHTRLDERGQPLEAPDAIEIEPVVHRVGLSREDAPRQGARGLRSERTRRAGGGLAVRLAVPGRIALHRGPWRAAVAATGGCGCWRRAAR